VTKYTCIDRRRCEKQTVPIEDENCVDPKPNPEEELAEKEERAIFLKIFRSLPLHCRELWQMVNYEKLRYSEIARRLNISEGTVKSRVARCKERASKLANSFSGNPGWAHSTV
jgi:RNA polymerase sigma-70 factor (ECF subfamily)